MAIASIIEGLGAGHTVRLTELGKIKIGGLGAARQSAGGGSYRTPEKHDHFTITTLHRGPANGSRGDLLPDRELMVELLDLYGDGDGKLRQIPVRLLSNDIEDVLQSAFVWYGGKTVGARSDGQAVTWFNDPRTGKRNDPPREEAWKPEFLELKDTKGNNLFKLHSVFNCIVASRESRFGGVYKFRTTSVVSFKQLYASLLHVHELTGGILTNLPLFMVVRPIQVAPDGKPTTVYVVHVEIRGASIDDVQLRAQKQMQFALDNHKRMAAAQTEYRKLLAAPGHETPEEAGDIAAEFAPEMTAPDEAPADFDLMPDEPAPVEQAPTEKPPAEEPPAPEAPIAGEATAAILCDECNSHLAAGETKCHNCGHVAGTPVTSKPSPKPGRPRRAEAPSQAPAVAPVKNETPAPSPAEKILGTAGDSETPEIGEPSPEEKVRIEVEEAPLKSLTGFILAMKSGARTGPLIELAIAAHGVPGVLLTELPQANVRAIALEVKLAMLKR